MGIGIKKKRFFDSVGQTFLALAIILLQDGSVWALNMELNPSVLWKLYYEDNIASVAQNQPGKTSGFSNRYEPKLKFGLTSSRIAITGETKLSVNRYLSDKEWDNTDRDYSIAGDFKLNPRSQFSLSAQYSLTSDPERYFTDNAGFQGGILVRRNQNESKVYTANYGYSLSPRNSMQANFSYITYSSEFKNSGDMYMNTVGFSRIMSSKDKLAFTLGYNHFKYSYGVNDTSGTGNAGFKMDTYRIGTGLLHTFTDSCKLDFSLGWYYTETKQRQAVFEQDPDTGETVLTGTKAFTNSTTGSNFSFLLEKKYFHTTMQFTAKQALGTNPDTGQTYPTLYFRFTVEHAITSKWKCSGVFSYYKNKADAGDFNNRVNIDYNSYASGLKLQYLYRRNITFSLNYSRVETENSLPSQSDRKIIRNNIFLECSIALQRPFIVR